jgi:DNA-binding beta-propeller fold protein YncE
MNWKLLPSLLALSSLLVLAGCDRNDHQYSHEDPASFIEISTIDIGEAGAAEISAYDPLTKKLFTVTNAGAVTTIDVIDLSNPASPVRTGFIDISPYGGGVNSVAVYEGKLAAAVEASPKSGPGKVVIFKTSDYSVVKQITVGALPDMITYTYDGKYILTANEGEPETDYSADPAGTVSIISVRENYAVTTLDFSAFVGQEAFLKSKGFRVFGPTGFIQNIEPEYITVSQDSKTAWVTLQENNAIAKLDIRNKRFTNIFPLGFKNYDLEQNAMDPSDRDTAVRPATWNVKGMYQPDAIAVGEDNGIPYLFTANEGDVREWSAFAENKRIKDVTLDPVAFPNGSILKQDNKLGRLNITSTLGDIDNDGDYDALYSFGARSFSIWNGLNGQLIWDSKNKLEKVAIDAGKYDDARSDDKGVEPEAITLGYVGRTPVAFVGMERADVIAIYDISNPYNPRFIKSLISGDAPEGLLFIPAQESPTRKSLLIVSSEGDGTIKIFQTN